MKIYIACSFACSDKAKTELRKAVMQGAEKILLDKNFTVYNPSKLKIENAWDYSMWDWGNLVFEEDKKQLDESDLIVFLSYGKENNAGAAWEIGYAYAKNKKVVVISLDKDVPESLMILHSAWTCMNSLQDLAEYDFTNLPRNKIERVES